MTHPALRHDRRRLALADSPLDLGLARRLRQTYVCGDDAPAVRRAYPGLALPPRPGEAFTIELRICGGEVASERGDDGPAQGPREIDRRPTGPECGDRVIAVEVFRDPVANGGRTLPEERVERRNVIRDKCLFVTPECLSHLR